VDGEVAQRTCEVRGIRWVCVSGYVSVCVCVCVREREREVLCGCVVVEVKVCGIERFEVSVCESVCGVCVKECMYGGGRLSE